MQMRTQLCSHRRPEAAVFSHRYHLLWLVPTMQWQLSIAFRKCDFIYFGNQNIPSLLYALGYIVLPCVTARATMDLGIYMSFDRKLIASTHCSRITVKAFGIAS